jgi:hypothetical protein
VLQSWIAAKLLAFLLSRLRQIRGHDQLRSPEGQLVYDNRYVIWASLRWGRMHAYEVYEDTEKCRGLRPLAG